MSSLLYNPSCHVLVWRAGQGWVIRNGAWVVKWLPLLQGWTPLLLTWDSRPRRLSTFCHFLFEIRGLDISLPIVLAGQWPTSPQFVSVQGHSFVPQSAPVQHCSKMTCPASDSMEKNAQTRTTPRLKMAVGKPLYNVANSTRQYLLKPNHE